jgi:hypothetical protein
MIIKRKFNKNIEYGIIFKEQLNTYKNRYEMRRVLYGIEDII